MRLAFLHGLLLLGLVPGLPGAIEDAAHLLAEGHTLHEGHHDAAPSVEHGDPEDEDQGCEDCGHEGLCHCHGGASLAAAPAHVAIDAASLALHSLVGPAEDHRSRLATDGLERPPRA